LCVTDVERTAADQLMAWAALFRDAFNGGREAAWWASGEATLARFENPKQGRCSVLLLDPPVDLRELRAKHGRARGVEVRSWFGACPDEVLEDWARLTTLMEEGAPMGVLARPASRSDLESVRLDEQRMQGQGWLLVRSIARLAGVSVGYTQMLLSRHDREIITEDDWSIEHIAGTAWAGRSSSPTWRTSPRYCSRRRLRRDTERPPCDPDRSRTEPAGSRPAQPSATPRCLVSTGHSGLNRACGFRDADHLAILEGPIRRRGTVDQPDAPARRSGPTLRPDAPADVPAQRPDPVRSDDPVQSGSTPRPSPVRRPDPVRLDAAARTRP